MDEEGFDNSENLEELARLGNITVGSLTIPISGIMLALKAKAQANPNFNVVCIFSRVNDDHLENTAFMGGDLEICAKTCHDTTHALMQKMVQRDPIGSLMRAMQAINADLHKQS
jgi:hypothetical protein